MPPKKAKFHRPVSLLKVGEARHSWELRKNPNSQSLLVRSPLELVKFGLQKKQCTTVFSVEVCEASVPRDSSRKNLSQLDRVLLVSSPLKLVKLGLQQKAKYTVVALLKCG